MELGQEDLVMHDHTDASLALLFDVKVLGMDSIPICENSANPAVCIALPC